MPTLPCDLVLEILCDYFNTKEIQGAFDLGNKDLRHSIECNRTWLMKKKRMIIHVPQIYKPENKRDYNLGNIFNYELGNVFLHSNDDTPAYKTNFTHEYFLDNFYGRCGESHQGCPKLPLRIDVSDDHVSLFWFKNWFVHMTVMTEHGVYYVDHSVIPSWDYPTAAIIYEKDETLVYLNFDRDIPKKFVVRRGEKVDFKEENGVWGNDLKYRLDNVVKLRTILLDDEIAYYKRCAIARGEKFTPPKWR